MELKSTLKDYTASEFQFLVRSIWAVDLPKREHDRLINHFDQIVGHPQGADLLFYPEEESISNSPELVVSTVMNWHHKRGTAAFKDETFPPVGRPAVSLSAAARNLAKLQELSADGAASEKALDTAFRDFDEGIEQQRSEQSIDASAVALETRIRAVEHVRNEAHTAFRKMEFWKRSANLVMGGTQRNLSYARSDEAQWHAQVQQCKAIQDHYFPRLVTYTQRFASLYQDAEALLIGLLEQLISARGRAGAGPGNSPSAVTASLSLAGNSPDILLAAGPLVLHPAQLKALQKSIRSAVGEFIWQKIAGEPSEKIDCAVVLQFLFSSRADTEVYGISVPLVELLVLEGLDWQHLAAIKAEVHVPIRMNSALVDATPVTMFQGMRQVKQLPQVYITAFQGTSPAPNVRVRAALRNEHSNGFSFTTDGPAPITVNWTAPLPIQISSPISRPPINRLGFIQSAPVPLLEPLIYKDELRFDDYIVVFPDESGVEPVYLMFRNRDEYPV